MEIKPVAVFRSPFKAKFGIPKQSGMVEELEGMVVLLPEYGNPDFIRGIEGFDYLWLVWQFSANKHALTSAVVRPPLLGGNEKAGTFATRSPYRPNPIGLSSVRLVSVNISETKKRIILNVRGADLADGTPVFDIKPYIPYTDSHSKARAGFTDNHPIHRLKVEILPDVSRCLPESDLTILRKVLELDPRPHYHHDAARIYGMPFGRYDIKFRVEGDVCFVVGCDLINRDAL
ncbi:MAG: tRNA (N6-threonylcarbamoyladenosine(37)-N6)-methyltransferase TrmO [Prevotella sp.]|nr:tRNA (N6-threonylcarbamoyladenosine(37)-N6)-methyltransferase TrmO [Prevotella sp.]